MKYIFILAAAILGFIFFLWIEVALIQWLFSADQPPAIAGALLIDILGTLVGVCIQISRDDPFS